MVANARNCAEQVDLLKRNCSMFFGTAGPEFMRRVVSRYKTTKALREKVSKMRDDALTRLLPYDAIPEHQRAMKRFAQVEVAGRLAVEEGILPLEEADVISAVATIAKRWLSTAAMLPDVERGIEQVKSFLLRNRDGRLKRLRAGDTDDSQMRDVAGYRDEAGGTYFLLPLAFKEACEGFDHRSIASALRERGLLQCDRPDRSTHRVMVGGTRLECYAVKVKLLASAEDGDAQEEGGEGNEE